MSAFCGMKGHVLWVTTMHSSRGEFEKRRETFRSQEVGLEKLLVNVAKTQFMRSKFWSSLQ